MNTLIPQKQVQVAVESDDLRRDKYMVVIRDSDGSLIGIPLRGVELRDAQYAAAPLMYAFEYGMSFAQTHFRRLFLASHFKTTQKIEP
jgi:hypothetical protein